MKAALRVLGAVLTVIFLAGGGAAAAHFLMPGGLLARLGIAAPQEVYACPMEPEVRQEGPGKCPKCGMDLVPLSQIEEKGEKPHEGAHPPAAEGRAPAEKGEAIYYCPMHPAYTSDKPGDCPICNMSLVKLEDDGGADETGSTVEGHATVTVRPAQRQLIGVTTGPVERKAVKKPLRTVGRVGYDERKLSAVALKFSGWIEELGVKAVGEEVKKGQSLLSIYSPELLESQRNYLVTLEASRAGGAHPAAGAAAALEQSLRSARDRLLLWDLTEEQIQEIEAKKEPLLRMEVRSKTSGVVTERNVVQGEYVEMGKVLFRLADLSTVWIDADIYEPEVALVKPGDAAKVTLPSFPGEAFEFKVTYIYPTLDQETRTVRARLEAENAGGKFKPGMYAQAAIEVDLGVQMVVDDGAVLDTGTRQIAFVDLGDGRLEPREIKAGQRAAGLIVVLEGLKEGERVVTSATFLIDSESRLKAALRKGRGGGMGGHAHGSMEGGKTEKSGPSQPGAPAAADKGKAEPEAPPAPTAGHKH